MLRSVGSITLVLMRSKIESLLTRNTRTLKLLKIVLCISLPGIIPNLFFDLAKPPLSTENGKILLALIIQKISAT